MLHDPQLWILVSFLLFVALSGRRFYRIVTLQLDERAHTIARQIREVASLHEEVQRILSKEKDQAHKARAHTIALEAQTKEETKRIIEDSKSRLQSLQKSQARELEDRLQALRKKMHLEAQDDLLQRACALTRVFMMKKITKTQQESFLKEQIKNLNI